MVLFKRNRLSSELEEKSIVHDQRGVVAIFSVLVIMGILTLLTMAFSNITRQAQRRTLDDHLNTQAYYAAESGVNLAMTNIQDKTACEPQGSENYDIDASNNISVSCLLIDTTPGRIIDDYVPIDNEGGKIGYLSVPNPTNTINISWGATSGDRSAATGPDNVRDASSSLNSPNFYPGNQWSPNQVGVLRVDLIPVNSQNPASLGSRSSLVNDSFTFYLYPTRNALNVRQGTVTPGPGGTDGHGKVLVTDCNSSNDNAFRCSNTITLGGGNTYNSFYYRLTSLYSPVTSSIRVAGVIDPSAPPATINYQDIEDGQAVIDSTGRANDVYRRIQVRVPIRGSMTNSINAGSLGLDIPSYALFAEDVCKRYSIYSDNGNDATNDGTSSCSTRPQDP